jgi:hypothetical protein
VQVKSRTFQRGETYEINLTGPGGRRYKKADLDMFAVYVAPVEVWYIGPFEVMERRGTFAGDAGAAGGAVRGVSGGLGVVAGWK